MKPILTILILTLSLSAFGQRRLEYWQKPPYENFVSGGVLVGTFVTIQLVQPYVTHRDGCIIAATGMFTAWASWKVIGKIRQRKEIKRRYY